MPPALTRARAQSRLLRYRAASRPSILPITVSIGWVSTAETPPAKPPAAAEPAGPAAAAAAPVAEGAAAEELAPVPAEAYDQGPAVAQEGAVADGREGLPQAAAEEGAIPPLFALMATGPPSVQEQAAAALWSLTAHRTRRHLHTPTNLRPLHTT